MLQVDQGSSELAQTIAPFYITGLRKWTTLAGVSKPVADEFEAVHGRVKAAAEALSGKSGAGVPVQQGYRRWALGLLSCGVRQGCTDSACQACLTACMPPLHAELSLGSCISPVELDRSARV